MKLKTVRSKLTKISQNIDKEIDNLKDLADATDDYELSNMLNQLADALIELADPEAGGCEYSVQNILEYIENEEAVFQGETIID